MTRSQKHWYEASGLGCRPNTVPSHRRASRHMNFCAHTWNARQSTGKIASSGFSTCQCNWIFTPSESHDGLGRARNMNVCALGSGYMWCQHILIKLLDVPHFVRPHILFSIYSCRYLVHRVIFEKKFKEHQFFWIWYTMSCTTWIVVLLPCIFWY